MRQSPAAPTHAPYDPTIDLKLVQPFVEQTCYVFERLLAWQLEPSRSYVKSSSPPTFDISGIVRFAGRVRGAVVLSLPRATACRATSLLLERPSRYLNDDVADAVRELTNTVTGRAAGFLTREGVRFSLPVALVGRTRPLEWPADLAPVVIELHSAADSLALEIGLEAESLAAFPSPGRHPGAAVLF